LPSFIFIRQKNNREEAKYAMYSTLTGKAFTPFVFDGTKDTIITFDPDFFEEIVEEIFNPPGAILDEELNNKLCNTIILTQNGKYGLYGFDGKEIIPAKYTSIRFLNQLEGHDYQDLLAVKKDNKYALFNTKGKVMTDFIYDQLSIEGQYIKTVKGTANIKLNEYGKPVK